MDTRNRQTAVSASARPRLGWKLLKIACVVVLQGAVALPWSIAAAGAEPAPVAVFAFELAGGGASTDPTGMTAAGAAMIQGNNRLAEADRKKLETVTEELRRQLVAKGDIRLVDLGPLAEKIKDAAPLHKCNGCETDLAREAGARLAILGKVQKLTAVLIHIDLTVKDVASDTVVRSTSVDVQGDTEESWTRGVRWLVRNRLADLP